MTYREHIIVLFSTHSVLLEGSRQDDSTYTLEEHQMRLSKNPKMFSLTG